MLVLLIGVVALFIAYVTSHLVFATQITPKRRFVIFLTSIASLYVAVGSTVFFFS
ncbi:hypothetical protein [Staphylococcus aureus]|uniref:hypothetical protein n=1 Tax=Staphylococcus aureus TaxID=1280 RepID=UPI0013B0594F|nr:hypothetical protein [Staphylococcus aureus]MDN8674498.1 hypothetical protein [Staphylococcus aureus]MDN8977709.1 hypothetical protein [Staphylococcus aureus]